MKKNNSKNNFAFQDKMWLMKAAKAQIKVEVQIEFLPDGVTCNWLSTASSAIL
jgi:hypothetical protein